MTMQEFVVTLAIAVLIGAGLLCLLALVLTRVANRLRNDVAKQKHVSTDRAALAGVEALLVEIRDLLATNHARTKAVVDPDDAEQVEHAARKIVASKLLIQRANARAAGHISKLASVVEGETSVDLVEQFDDAVETLDDRFLCTVGLCCIHRTPILSGSVESGLSDGGIDAHQASPLIAGPDVAPSDLPDKPILGDASGTGSPLPVPEALSDVHLHVEEAAINQQSNVGRPGMEPCS